MSRILAFIDGSTYAESVCRLTAWAAVRLEHSVEIAHVLGRRMSGSFDLSGSLEADQRSALLDEYARLDEQHARLAQAKGRALLDTARTIVAAGGVEHVETKLRHGDLMEALADLEKDAAMVVVGKRGEAADFARMHLGSNLERIVRTATRPVLVAARAYTPFDRFLIAFDGGRSANRAVDFVASGNLLKGLKATVLSVGADTAENRSRLEAPVHRLREAGFEVEGLLRQGEPDDVIGTHVDTQGIGLLVMGAYGHSRIRSLVIGSTTEAMVRRCKVPVLMFR
ncbi:universal stress protein [Aquibium sp. ELW1220]|jgi:nucleotide-binding universal stress UspA family protein|uniref:universal stress protein n=1 Tax=Aquibium sp. ELW1220 TaxID=2976766 RepID=UPI0025B0F86B|nr:universal stress protein [Aquibium sp. ELW1220]MDN2581744.1 universal stress protein [Aquibium sp. ELW1220]